MDSAIQTDRYISFCGIECDKWADELTDHLNQQLAKDSNRLWRQYFEQKFKEQATMGHDNLFFVGSQMNSLYSFFNEIEDQKALELLWNLEQQCC